MSDKTIPLLWNHDRTRLVHLGCTTYTAGDIYSQAPAEIHSTHPIDGTITLMQKFPTDDESARVYWPFGTEWVSAEPRTALTHEIERVAGVALAQLAKERTASSRQVDGA